MKRQKMVRFVAALIAGVLVATMLFGIVADMFMSASAAPTQAAVDEMKKQLDQSEAKKADLKKKIADIQTQKVSIADQIHALDADIANTQSQIDIREDMIAALTELVAQKEQELTIAQQKEQEQYEQFKTRIRVMYEQGETTYLEVLLSSADFSDFLSRYEIVTQIATYDKNLFEELKALKEDIATKKLELETDKAEEESARAALVASKNELDTQMANRANSMKALESSEADTKASYDEIEQEEARINNQIDKMVKEMEEEARRKAAESGKPVVDYSGDTFGWPLPGHTRISCVYGMREHPVTGVYKLHTGVDLPAPTGTKIVAAQSGTVITAGYSSAWGNYVVISHGGGLSTLYAHMSKLGTTKGAEVKMGEQIGKVGSTGYSTGPHLHFEVRKNSGTIDPMSFFN